MSAGFRPMEVQSRALRDELTQHPIPAPPRGRLSVSSGAILSSKSKLIVVERRARSKVPASNEARNPADTQAEYPGRPRLPEAMIDGRCDNLS